MFKKDCNISEGDLIYQEIRNKMKSLIRPPNGPKRTFIRIELKYYPVFNARIQVNVYC